MFLLRYSIAVGVVAMALPVAQQAPVTAKSAAVQGGTSNGTSDGTPAKTAAKSQYAGKAAGAPAPAQPAPAQPGPSENYGDGGAPAKKSIAPGALSELVAGFARVAPVRVPGYTGMTLDEVRRENAKLMPGTKRPLFVSIYPPSAEGVVVWQDPAKDSMVVPGTKRLVLKLEVPPPPPPQVTRVPPLQGLSREEAFARLQSRALVGDFQGDPNGIVHDSIPAEGATVAQESTVRVTLVPRPVTVPPLKGLTRAATAEVLATNHLQLGSVSGQDVEGATVQEQQPGPDSPVEQGSQVAVTLVVTERVKVPYVKGMRCGEALALIQSRRLEPRLVSLKQCPPDTVRIEEQEPAVDTLVAPGSDVHLVFERVKVPALVKLPFQKANDDLERAGLLGDFTFPADWTPAKSVVKDQYPDAGAEVDAGSRVRVEIRNLLWWESVPVWGWVALGAVLTWPLGSFTKWVWKKLFQHPVPDPDLDKRTPQVPPPPPPAITFQPHGAASRVRLRDADGPKVRLAIALRDRVGESRTTVEGDPAVTVVTEMEVS